MHGNVAARKRALIAGLGAIILSTMAATACGGGDNSLTIYSSRTQSLVQPLLQQYAEQESIDVNVKYLNTAALVASIQEEGQNTPADVVYIAEPGGLGALSHNGVLSELPGDLLGRVDSRLRSPRSDWVGTSGRAKTVAYNRDSVDPGELPTSIWDFTDPSWEGRIGWAPRHGEFQVLITAMRKVWGEEKTRQWLAGIQANDPQEYPNLISTVQGVADGEVDVGFVNHYYIPRFMDEEGEDFEARNYYLGGQDPGALVTVAGIGIVKHTNNREKAERFVEFMLGQEAQRYFAEQTKEYPLAARVEPLPGLPPLDQVDPPDMDLGNLEDLQGTLELMRDAGVIQ